jgi:beta-glucosidase
VFEKVQKTGKPVVMILYGGRPKAITKQLDQTSGVLFAFGVGEQGNEALFDILYGKVNPSGKLPISFPRSTGHLPCFYNYKPSARGNLYQAPGSLEKPGYDYVFDTPKALFPFGFGLSYTTFEYSEIQTEKVGRYAFNVKVTVKNTGDLDGDECVLLFLSNHTQRVTPIVKRLRKFKRISLKKGEEMQVCFRLTKEDFTFVDEDMKRRPATGKCDVMIAGKKCVIELG